MLHWNDLQLHRNKSNFDFGIVCILRLISILVRFSLIWYLEYLCTKEQSLIYFFGEGRKKNSLFLVYSANNNSIVKIVSVLMRYWKRNSVVFLQVIIMVCRIEDSINLFNFIRNVPSNKKYPLFLGKDWQIIELCLPLSKMETFLLTYTKSQLKFKAIFLPWVCSAIRYI